MRTSAKAGLTALMAALLLSAALSTASARNLEVSSQRFRVIWRTLEFQTSRGTIRCQVTLEGSFHSSTIPKVERLLIGTITRVDVKRESCEGGELLIINSTLPWHVTYESFTGTLPTITAVRLLLRRLLYRFSLLGVNCFYGTATDNFTFSANLNAAREVTNLVAVAGRNIANLLEGSRPGEFFGCSTSQSFVTSVEDGVVTVLNSTTRIRITLI
jgi:hypothetical protein